MRSIKYVAVAAVFCLVASMFSLVGCGSDDAQYFKGEWQIKDSDVTVVFTGTEFKNGAANFGYTVDSGKKTITFTSGSMTGGGSYELSDDHKTLKLIETNADGVEVTTTFEKLSDDVTKEPYSGADVPDSSSSDDSSAQGSSQ